MQVRERPGPFQTLWVTLSVVAFLSIFPLQCGPGHCRQPTKRHPAKIPPSASNRLYGVVRRTLLPRASIDPFSGFFGWFAEYLWHHKLCCDRWADVRFEAGPYFAQLKLLRHTLPERCRVAVQLIERSSRMDEKSIFARIWAPVLRGCWLAPLTPAYFGKDRLQKRQTLITLAR